MIDLGLFVFIAALLLLGIRRPFVWVLAYIYIDVVSPLKIGWGVIQSLPVSLIAFGAAFAGWLFLDSKRGSRFGLRQALIVALLAYCGVTTLSAAPGSTWFGHRTCRLQLASKSARDCVLNAGPGAGTRPAEERARCVA